MMTIDITPIKKMDMDLLRAYIERYQLCNKIATMAILQEDKFISDIFSTAVEGCKENTYKVAELLEQVVSSCYNSIDDYWNDEEDLEDSIGYISLGGCKVLCYISTKVLNELLNVLPDDFNYQVVVSPNAMNNTLFIGLPE